MRNPISKLIAASLSTLALAMVASAAEFNQYSIGLNFGANEPAGGNLGGLLPTDVAGVPPVAQPNWNSFSGNLGTNDSIIVNVNGAGVATPIHVEWSAAGTWSPLRAGEQNGLNFMSNNLPDHTLITGYLDQNAANQGVNVIITNIPSAMTSVGYDVYIYALGSVPARGGSYRVYDARTGAALSPYLQWQADVLPTNYVRDLGGTDPITRTNMSGNYLLIKGLTNAFLRVEGTNGVNPVNGTARAPIAAVQLVAAVNAGEATPVTGLTVSTNSGIRSLTLSWTPGTNSTGSLVIMRAARAVTAQPVDGVAYNANPGFGLGANLLDDNAGLPNFVVYSGSASTVTITNLFAATNYSVAVYSYNGSGGSIDYSLASPATTNGTPIGSIYAITLSQPSAPVVAGTARRIQTLALYGDGGVLDVTTTAAYTSATPAVVSFPGALPVGKFAAVTNGTANIWAAYQGLFSTQSISVVSVSLTHRYNFSGDFATTNVFDTATPGVGDGYIVTGDGSSGLDGSGHALLSGTAGNYVVLPPDLFTNYGGITLEAWALDNAALNWARVWDFGANTTINMFMSPTAAGTVFRAAITIGGAGTEYQVQRNSAVAAGAEHHYVYSIEGSTRVTRLFLDGNLVGSISTNNLTPEDLGRTANDWLGRSQYADPYFNGTLNEFRAYNGPISFLQVAIDTAAGPDIITNDPGTCSGVTLTLETTMNTGDQQQGSVVGTFSNLPNPMTLTTLPQTIYTTTSSSVATVSATGLVIANGPGTVTITATAFGKSNSVTITITTLPTALQHRWSFNGNYADSIGGADAFGAGNTIAFDANNQKVVLSGVGAYNNNNGGDYITLPPGLMANYNSVTLEAWEQETSVLVWSRVWDFNTQTTGGAGQSYLFLSQLPGNQTGMRTALLSPAAGGEQLINYVRPSRLKEHHVVYTSDGVTRTAKLYVDGLLVGFNTNVTGQPRDLGVAPNNWLGRSAFNADNWFQGSFNEFRMWRGAIDATQVAIDYQAGPDVMVLASGLGSFTSLNLTNMPASTVQPATFTFTGGNLGPLPGAYVPGGAPLIISNWVSSDPTVADVDQYGVISGVRGGTATISATYAGTTRSAAITISAANPVLAHRYSFTTDATDSAGGAGGVNSGGAVFNGGSVFFNGAVNSSIALPAIAFGPEQTFEIWLTYSNNIQANARAFDFGDHSTTNYFYFAPSSLAAPITNAGTTVFRYNIGQVAGNQEQTLSKTGRAVSGGSNVIHYVWIFSESQGAARLYINGVLQDVYPNVHAGYAHPGLKDILVTEGFLGTSSRTNVTAGSQNYSGAIDEFRIWNSALSQVQVESSYAQGPNASTPADPGAVSAVSLTLNDSTMVLGTIQRPRVSGTFASAGALDLTKAVGVKYVSDNSSVVSVGADDRLTAVGTGTANITATYGGVVSASAPVTVIAKPALQLTHRYNFSTDTHDLVGKADGVLRGNAVVAGGTLALDNSSAPPTYADLPADIISGYQQLTIESFLRVSAASGNQARLFDFGDRDNASLVQNVGWPSYFFMTITGGNGTQPRLALLPNPGIAGTEIGFTGNANLKSNMLVHIVAMMDSGTHMLSLYTNGLFAGAVSNNSTIDIANLQNNFNQIGRSQFGDPFLLGNIDDFRIYYGLMTAPQVAASFAAGADPERLTVTPGVGSVTVSWPASSMTAGFTLQSNTSLTAPGGWVAAGAPTVVGNFNQVVVPTSGSVLFFRLIK